VNVPGSKAIPGDGMNVVRTNEPSSEYHEMSCSPWTRNGRGLPASASRNLDARLMAVASDLEERLFSGVSRFKHGPAAYGETLAAVLASLQHDERDFSSYGFDVMLSHYIGTAMVNAVPDLLRLSARLALHRRHDGGGSGEYEYQTGRRLAGSLVHARRLGDDGGESRLSAFYVRVPSAAYAVFVRYSESYIGLHVRSIDRSGTGACPAMRDLVSAARHPSFEHFKMTVPGFRYLDARDSGYLASVEAIPHLTARFEFPLRSPFARLRFVWQDLLQAVDTFAH
jgi:hypothetical protein